jgi:nucleoid DNA-binding protein
MIPKKANKLYKQLSEDLNVPEDLVDTFISFYYKTVREHLSELKHPRINLEGLGHFNAMHSVVKSGIKRCTKSLENHDTSTFKAYHNKKGLEVKLEQLIIIEQQIAEEQSRKDNFKKTKNENSTKSNLEE